MNMLQTGEKDAHTLTHSRTSTHTRTLARKRHERGRETEKQDARERERERETEREEWIEKGQPGVTTIQGMGNIQQVHRTDVDTQMSACR